MTKGNTDNFFALSSLHRAAVQTFIGLLVAGWPSWHKEDKVRNFCSFHKIVKFHYWPQFHRQLNYRQTARLKMCHGETSNVYFESIEDLEAAIF